MDLNQVKKLNIPTGPGSYQYYDGAGKIIYIGKAANLRSRVLSYWRESANHTPAKEQMLTKIAKIKWIETDTEIEALLLEANLVKKYQPYFNVDLKDDKRHIYIKITDDEFPRVLTTREIDKSGRYFGPFTSGTAVRETIKAIGKIFPYGRFITMAKSRTNDIKSQRYPELYGATGDPAEYKKIIRHITAFLEGDSPKIIREIEKEIKLLSLQAKRNNLTSTATGGIASSSRGGTPRNDSEEKISQLKYRLLNMRNVLSHSNIIGVHEKYAADVVELAKILNLPAVPKRIEGYDISNLFGQEAVGSMVVFADGEPDKSQYRKFKIRGTTPKPLLEKEGGPTTPQPLLERRGDDTGMLREILERRFNNDWAMPDLIIIDGGKGQLNACLSVLKKLKLEISILAISKGEGLRSAHAPDKIFFPKMKTALQLPLASPALHIVKRVRDEAHRFAIGFHRQRRTKNWLNK
jgi:Nuclease subunit of the excinuclease complex